MHCAGRRPLLLLRKAAPVNHVASVAVYKGSRVGDGAMPRAAWALLALLVCGAWAGLQPRTVPKTLSIVAGNGTQVFTMTTPSAWRKPPTRR
jgi:hypothetical protein